MDYNKFLEQKKITTKSSGFEVDRDKLNPLLFDYQKDIVKWALKKGKSAIWSGTGTGKTNMELEFAKQEVGATEYWDDKAVSITDILRGDMRG